MHLERETCVLMWFYSADVNVDLVYLYLQAACESFSCISQAISVGDYNELEFNSWRWAPRSSVERRRWQSRTGFEERPPSSSWRRGPNINALSHWPHDPQAVGHRRDEVNCIRERKFCAVPFLVWSQTLSAVDEAWIRKEHLHRRPLPLSRMPLSSMYFSRH